MQEIHWIKQERECDKPWTIQVFHVYSKRKPANQSLDFVLYSEAFENETNSVSLFGLDKNMEIEDYLEILKNKLSEISDFVPKDEDQLRAALTSIINA